MYSPWNNEYNILLTFQPLSGSGTLSKWMTDLENDDIGLLQGWWHIISSCIIGFN